MDKYRNRTYEATGRQYFYKNNKRHRDNDLPAGIYPDGTQFWYQNGELHRDNDKPAILGTDKSEGFNKDRQEWYKNGVQYTPVIKSHINWNDVGIKNNNNKPIYKAIETIYKGYRFRSRNEARWSIFFNSLSIKFEYEPEGFILPSGRYLPDFWLPQVKMYAEVKSVNFSKHELALASELYQATGYEVLLLVGTPDGILYPAFTNKGNIIYYDIQEGHRYWETENRFYSEDFLIPKYTGDETKIPSIFETQKSREPNVSAIEAARSARFEFGESGLD